VVHEARSDLAYELLLEAINEEHDIEGLVALRRVFDKFSQRPGFPEPSEKIAADVNRAIRRRLEEIRRQPETKP